MSPNEFIRHRSILLILLIMIRSRSLSSMEHEALKRVTSSSLVSSVFSSLEPLYCGDKHTKTNTFSLQSLRNVTLLLILSIQVGVNPVMINWYASKVTNVALRCTVIDTMKILIALACLVAKGQLVPQARRWSLTLAIQTTLLPSLIYALQNYLNQNAVTNLDGVTFNILNQTKIIWTAALVYLVLRQKQSQRQLVALLLLLYSAILMATRSSRSVSFSTDDDDDDDSDLLSKTSVVGIFQALAGACLSGIAGTMIQRGLQDHRRNAYLVTIELSLGGIIGLWLSKWILACSMYFFFSHGEYVMATSEEQRRQQSSQDIETPEGLWHGWTFMTWIVMVLQALGGVLIGFVMKYTGNIMKNFAVVAGLILTAFLESIYNHKPFGWTGVLCIVLVSTSTYLYAKYPYRPSSILAR